ncbi:MAG TPA: TerC family protein [Terriglobales bacterium]|nr:TerC family protein [Terriglobales bacterium]
MLQFWILFNVFVLAMLALDLWGFNRPGRQLSLRQALAWSIMWVALAAIFAVLLYFWRGHDAALEFTTGYIVELSLSVDNLFLFLVIFRYFRVPGELQHKVLFWGILGAIVMRGIFIAAGIQLIHAFHWMIYAFGAFLIYSGLKLWTENEEAVQPDKNPVLRLFRRWVPVTENYEGDKFFVRRATIYATPLLVVLLVVETTDLLFATDSIPAVLAITLKPFIVYTSNVFAVLGLRSLFFVLAGMIEMFHYLHYGLSIILIFIGAKMLVSDYYRIPTSITLAVIAAVLLVSVLLSIAHPKTKAS